MTYLIIGEDNFLREQKIAELKEKILGARRPETPNFDSAASLRIDPDQVPAKRGRAEWVDYEVLYANKLGSAELKKSLLSLPVLVAQRMILVREAHRLSLYNQQLVADFATGSSPHAVLVLESESLDPESPWLKKIKSSLKVIECRGEEKPNVFALTRMVSQGQTAPALKILDALLKDGNHPLQIMGGLVWFWGKSRDKISLPQFKKGLLALQEADFNIKRSRIEPGCALELLVVKLSAA